MRNLDKVGEDVGKDTAEVVEDSEEDGVVDKVTNTGGEEDDNDKEEVVDKVREAPFWNVLFPYGYCPNSFRPTPPSVKRALWSTFLDPMFSSVFFRCTNYPGNYP